MSHSRNWGMVAAYRLMKVMNCSLASLETAQDMAGRRQDAMLRAATGMEGGLVARGATCGVVSGGSLGLALAFEEPVLKYGLAAEKAVLDKAADYTRWFAAQYGTTLCAERTGADFSTFSGQLAYFLAPHKFCRCLAHIHGAMGYLEAETARDLPVPADGGPPGRAVHCAREVLARIREATGVGDKPTETLSFIFDGGVGLSGGACGALIGAVLGINLLWGVDVRSLSYARIWGPFLRGHVNLFHEKPLDKPEPFALGKSILDRVEQEAGSILCRDLCGKSFDGWDDFAPHVESSAKCREIMDLAAGLATDIILKWK